MTAQSAAIAVGLRAAARHAKLTIAYSRGNETLSFAAIKSRRPEQLETGQAWVSTKLCDWICLASNLASLTPAEPAVGDIITKDGLTYVVTAAEDGRHWRYVDPAQTWVRVHTIRG